MISFEIWLVWAIIGIVGGYMTSRLLTDGTHLWLQCLVGVLGSLLAGWTFLSLISVPPEAFTKWSYVSLLVAGAGAALVLWPVVVWIKGRSEDEPENND